MNIESLLEPFLPLMIRFILGGLFFFQAYDKLFRIGLKETNSTIYPAYQAFKIPQWFIRISIWVSSYIELIGGVLLFVGLFKPLVLLLLGINLIMVSIAFSFQKGIWDMNHFFPRIALLVALFLIPFNWDVWSLDCLISCS